MNIQNSESEDIIPQDEQKVMIGDSNNAKRFSQAICITWWGGTALIVGSWVGIVSNTVG